MTTVRLLPVTTEQACLRCFDVMRELRPHLAGSRNSVSRIMWQRAPTAARLCGKHRSARRLTNGYAVPVLLVMPLRA